MTVWGRSDCGLINTSDISGTLARRPGCWGHQAFGSDLDFNAAGGAPSHERHSCVALLAPECLTYKCCSNQGLLSRWSRTASRTSVQAVVKLGGGGVCALGCLNNHITHWQGVICHYVQHCLCGFGGKPPHAMDVSAINTLQLPHNHSCSPLRWESSGTFASL